MGSRLKEDERNERTIRNLLKLPENRRCINCNSLGPQYVCTSFWTFVCTTCSGIHREFTHRVKSVSMAKFTSQEVSALQGGGNASAKEIYFKEWDPQRQTFPDSSNAEKLRDFIKHVYVDRRYTGERSFDKPPRVKTGETEDSFQGGSRSPPYESERRYSDRPSPGGRSDDRSSKNSYDERRSPGYDQDNRQYSDYGRSPSRTEVVNDWRREDRFGNGRRPEDKMSDGGSKVDGRSPDRQRDLDMASPPMVRPVREILGESVSPLRVIEPPRANGARAADGSLHTQITASSSSLASSNGNPTELRRESSLIDFDAVPEPPSSVPVPQTQQTAPSAPAPAPSSAPFVAQQTSSPNDNWANFDSVPQVKAPQASSNANILDVLSELSVPASLPVQVSALGASVTTPGGSFFPSNSNPPAAPTVNVQMLPSGMTLAPSAAAAATPGQPFDAFGNAADGRQWQNVRPPQNHIPGTGNQPLVQSFNQGVGGSLNNQPWNPSLGGNTQVPSSAAAHSQATSGVESKPTVKRELPADLFTPNYSAFAAPTPGWYPVPQYGMGFNMQYNVPAPMPPAFPQQSKSLNPFDVNEPSPGQATFPSMAPLQRALPNMEPPLGVQRPSSLGTPTWITPQSSNPLAIPQGHGSAVPSGPFMGQIPPNMPPAPRPQVGGFGFDSTAFGSFNPSQQQSGLFSAPAATPNTSSSNPFG